MKNLKSKKIIVLVLALVLTLGMAGCKDKDENSNDGVFKDMETTDLNGNKVNSSIFNANKLTLVNVWSVDCGPCVWEIPHLSELNEEYKDKGVSIKGLCYNFNGPMNDAAKERFKTLVKEKKATHQQLLISDDMAESNAMKNLVAFPTTFFVDSAGNIIDKLEGAYEKDEWKEKIEKVLESLNDEKIK